MGSARNSPNVLSVDKQVKKSEGKNYRNLVIITKKGLCSSEFKE